MPSNIAGWLFKSVVTKCRLEAGAPRHRFGFRTGIIVSVLASLAMFVCPCLHRQLSCQAETLHSPGEVEASRHANKGYALFQQSKLPEAEQEYRQAIKHSPGTADYHLGLISVLFKMERWQALADQYKTLLDLPSQADKADVLSDYGNVLNKLQRYEEAATILRKAVELDSGRAEAHQRLADALMQAGKGPEAVSEYQEALKLKPDEPGFHYNIGSLYWRMGQPGDAVESYRKAAELKPDDAGYQAALGYALYHAKNYPEAVEAYRKAVRLNTRDDSLQRALQGALDAQEYERKMAEEKAREEAERKAEAAAAKPARPYRRKH